MNLRQQQEDFENKYLNARAAKSSESLGREKYEEPCIIRTDFQRDRDRIIHSKAFRRLKHKTQVFISPQGDHYRTRLTHTLEVAQIARTIARALSLNEDLTEAISMGHDLGHTPFGHTGEKTLDRLLPGGFRHNEQSERVVTIIENLNLTKETIDGIRNHTGETLPFTMEGQIVKIADRIAYLNHDIDDAIRAGIINIEDIPKEIIATLGKTCSERIATMVCSMVRASSGKDIITLDTEVEESANKLRNWMFDNIYIGSEEKQKEALKAEMVVKELFNYYANNTNLLADYYNGTLNDPLRSAADYVAGMTDRYALKLYKIKFLPQPMNIDI
ncbi:MAG: deoxyguanosinetriphosphate triphosphohydrolase [Cyanobacteriota bacterium]